jgi:hypothetical protein
MSIPSYTDADEQASYKDKHNVEMNTLVQGEFGNTPAQATKVTELGVHFSNGEAHTHRQLHAAIERGHITVKGQRATN